jgi:hypothetical protein
MQYSGELRRLAKSTIATRPTFAAAAFSKVFCIVLISFCFVLSARRHNNAIAHCAMLLLPKFRAFAAASMLLSMTTISTVVLGSTPQERQDPVDLFLLHEVTLEDLEVLWQLEEKDDLRPGSTATAVRTDRNQGLRGT